MTFGMVPSVADLASRSLDFGRSAERAGRSVLHTGESAMKITAVLKMPLSAKKVGAFAQHIVTSLTDNASFPTPNPPLATISADVAALDAAEAAVLSRTKGAAETR